MYITLNDKLFLKGKVTKIKYMFYQCSPHHNLSVPGIQESNADLKIRKKTLNLAEE